jgi:uncharacterized membrane protein
MSVVSAVVILMLAAAGIALWRKYQRLSGDFERLRQTSNRQDDVLRVLAARMSRLEGGEPAAHPPPAPLSATVESPMPDQTRAPIPEHPAAPERLDDWETVVGTSWLNRIGALVLVIGIALFLGYSLTQLGPGGKVAIGFAVGLSMLAGGLAIEQKDRYRNFAPSLIAGGWAVSYFTGYALHGIEAARLIANPATGAAILLAISAAMIFHALRYRSEAATGLAFLFAFVSLNVTALTAFSVLATAVLAASLLFLASRFDWMRLAVAGTLLTYMTFVLRYDVSIYWRSGWQNGQAILWVYWVLFEGFDLIDLWRRGRRPGIAQTVFLLNAAGFTGASILHHLNVSSNDWARLYATAAIAYLVSSFIRARLVSAMREGADACSRRGYEASSGAAAALMAAALIQRYTGLQMPLALLMEGELVVLAGAYLRNGWIQLFGGSVLLLAFGRVMFVNTLVSTETQIATLRVHSWSPLALLMASVFTANRLLSAGGVLYGAAASILIAAVIEAEAEHHWTTAVWAVLSIAVLMPGVYWNKIDLRVQAYVGVLATFIRAVVVNLSAADSMQAMAPVAVTAALFYSAQALVRPASYDGKEAYAAPYASVMGTSLLTLLLFDAVQGRLLTVALGFEGAALLVAGFTWRERVLRVSGLVLFMLCIAKLFVYDLRELDTLSRILSFVVLGVMLLAASWVYTRFREKIRRLL